ncbi:MAG: YggS family pyridoxal phosphate-dependent enzyme [Acidimicrobiia bacterium]
MSLSEVEQRIAAACAGAGRDRSEVTLVAVSKGRSVEAIRALYDDGHRDFGENRAQELRDKVDELASDVRWHFVGPLQTNKVRVVRPSASVLHSMDRDSLATAWLKGSGHPPPVYLQVNIGEEEQKSGVAPADSPSFCDRLVSLGIQVVGLMAIPPLADDPEEARPHFAALRELRDAIAADHPAVTGLSMGMSDDFEVAISEGATSIRVGRAIFAD